MCNLEVTGFSYWSPQKIKSYFLRNAIRTNKGREATETEGLVYTIVLDVFVCLYVCVFVQN